MNLRPYFVAMKKIITSLVFGIVLISCTSKDEVPAPINQLNGTWARQFNGVHQVIKWEISETEVKSVNLFVNKTDSVLMDKADLNAKNNWDLELSYPNSDLIDRFTYSTDDDDKVTFTNKNKEWPQVLIYHKTSDTTMEVTTKGYSQGMPKEITFMFVKQ